ncbi:hypothetical protein M3Y94_00631700 [Aphelenchoides besseyi]|nr:hypothetical protein M3Y94_00630700 [Aphelenchoides besseyi]KAI6204086.1 hypothetical protein M3Y94_00631700 [Aphelenchoides besseyi]
MSDKKEAQANNAAPEDANTARDPTPSEEAKTAEKPTTSEDSHTARDPTENELKESRTTAAANRPVQEYTMNQQYGNEEYDMLDIMAKRHAQQNQVDPATAAAQKKLLRKAHRKSNTQ